MASPKTPKRGRNMVLATMGCAVLLFGVVMLLRKEGAKLNSLIQSSPPTSTVAVNRATPPPPEKPQPIASPVAIQPAPSNPITPLVTNPVPSTPVPASVTNASVTSRTYSNKVLRAQLALVRQGFSPGLIDGVLGPKTRAALQAFQEHSGLAKTGSLDPATEELLSWKEPLLVSYRVQESDVNRLLPVGKGWLEKSQQERLDYETLLEFLGERSQASAALLRQLNPGVSWDNPQPGMTVQLPNTSPPPCRSPAAWVRISLAERLLEAFDAETNLLAHFPCSIASKAEQRPVGELYVTTIALNPNYTFNPEIFPESAEAREIGRKLILQPGPNNPVGTVWIGLDRPGYGIHGTPKPEHVGRAESHGCFRLANWNAERLAKLVRVGTPVLIDP